MQKRIYLLSTLLPVLGFLFTTPALSAEADLVKAEKVYKRSCATCHGKQGEKPAMGESKIINQLKPEEISTALSERKAGNIRLLTDLSYIHLRGMAENDALTRSGYSV